MKVKMSVQTRLKLSEMLSNQSGSYARLKAIRLVREELSLSDEEIKAMNYQEQIDQRGKCLSVWDVKKDPMKECEVSELLTEIITKNLKELDEKGLLRDDQIALYEAFMNLPKAGEGNE